jgi:hypothetical protein
MAHLTEQDHADVRRIAELAGEALHLLKDFEARHGLDITGPALSALNRADVSLEFVPRELRLAEHYLGGLMTTAESLAEDRERRFSVWVKTPDGSWLEIACRWDGYDLGVFSGGRALVEIYVQETGVDEPPHNEQRRPVGALKCGHSLTAANLVQEGQYFRCVTCRRVRQASYRANLRASARAVLVNPLRGNP